MLLGLGSRHWTLLEREAMPAWDAARGFNHIVNYDAKQSEESKPARSCKLNLTWPIKCPQ